MSRTGRYVETLRDACDLSERIDETLTIVVPNVDAALDTLHSLHPALDVRWHDARDGSGVVVSADYPDAEIFPLAWRLRLIETL